MNGRQFVSLLLGAFVALLAAAAALQPGPVAYLGVAVALAVAMMAALGRERMIVVVLGAAFATAPMYRGLIDSDVATPTDVLMVLTLVLLLPEIFDRTIRVPAAFLGSIAVLGAFGLLGSLRNAAPIPSIVFVLQWLLVLGVVPVFLAVWQPSRRVIHGLLFCYLAGQMASVLKALAEGKAVNDRYDGFAHHSNDFGLAGAVGVAMLLYLFAEYRSVRARIVLSGLMAACLASVVMSGGRGVTLAAAAVIMMVPIVERSGVWAVVWTGLGAVGVAMLPFILKVGGEGSSLSRLAGDSTAKFSDNLREGALSEGFDRFLHSPFIGIGLDVVVGSYHNVFLEAALAVGIFGLAAYLTVLFVLARPLFGDHPHRRLCYLTFLFVVVGATFPGLVDRTISVPMALTILPAVRAAQPRLASVAARYSGGGAAPMKEVPAC